MVKKKDIKEWGCKNCGYVWIPRVKSPKKCPRCGVWLK